MEITLSMEEDGNVFGEMALTGQSLSGVHVRALAPSTVVTLRREELEELIMKKPEVGLRLVRSLAERLHASEGGYTPYLMSTWEVCYLRPICDHANLYSTPTV